MNTIECNAVMNAADGYFQSWTYWNSVFFNEEDDTPILKQVKPFVRMYPISTAGVPISLVFDTNNGSGFYAFQTNELTVDLAKQGEPIATVYVPVELYYQHGYQFEITPPEFSYKISPDNDHHFNLYGPSNGGSKDIFVVAKISSK